MRESTTPKIERKRQVRGQARIKTLLEAAEVVFARDGYHGATTNEISATAEVSPATLYQFFANKDEIANALTLRYAEEMAQLEDIMDVASFARMEALDMVSAVMDPMLNFHKTHPAFLTLLLDAPLSKEFIEAKHAIMKKFVDNLATMFNLRDPKMPTSEAEWTAQIFMIVFKGFIGEISSSSGVRKRRLIASFKGLLVSYLMRCDS